MKNCFALAVSLPGKTSEFGVLSVKISPIRCLWIVYMLRVSVPYQKERVKGRCTFRMRKFRVRAPEHANSLFLLTLQLVARRVDSSSSSVLLHSIQSEINVIGVTRRPNNRIGMDGPDPKIEGSPDSSS